MKKLFLLLMLFSFSSFADDQVKQAREHLRLLDEKNKEMAKLLVMATYMDILKIGDPTNPQQSYEELKKTFHETQDSLLEMSFNTSHGPQSIQKLTEHFVKSEKAMTAWLENRSQTAQNVLRYQDFFHSTNEICNDRDFSRAMALVNIQENKGLDFTALKGRFEISAFLDPNGAPDADEESGNTEGAIAITSAAAAMMTYNLTAVLVTQGVAGISQEALAAVTLPGVGWAIGAYLAVKMTAAYMKAKKHEKELKKLFKLNEQIFEKLDVEFNVRNYYNRYCSSLREGFSVTRSKAVDLMNDKIALSELSSEVERLNTILKEKGYNNQEPDLDKDPELLISFFTKLIYQRLIVVKEDMMISDAKSRRAYLDYKEIKSSSYELIRDLFLDALPVKYSKEEENFISQMKVYLELDLFRKEFTQKSLQVIQETDPVRKNMFFEELKNMFNFYETTRKNPLQEETFLIHQYEEIISELRGIL